jgi:iron complex outermembrane receptor protein
MVASKCRPRRIARYSASCLALVGLALAIPAAADEPAAKDEVEKVTVTAQKRSQNILDVGLNVSVVSGADVRDKRVEQMRDLSQSLGNLDVKEQVPGAMPVITIRGVGLDDFSSTNNPSAGIYIDEVFLSSLAMMSFDVYDLERIELLKGPQGTLYGRNSTAGAINVITAKPSTDGFDAFASAGYGNYETFDATGMVNLPVSETFAVRFAAKTIQQGEGLWFNRVTNEDVGTRDLIAGRAQAAWSPSESLDFILKFEGQRARSEMGQGEFFGAFEVPPPPPPGLPTPCATPGAPRCFESHGYHDVDGDPFTGDWSGDNFYNIDQWGTTLRADADLGGATLTSVTGYIQFERAFYIDTDATPLFQTDFIQSEKVNQISQELRLAGSQEGLVDWLVGGFYSHDHVTVNTPGFHSGLFNTNSLTFADQETDSAAAFAHAEWALSDQLKFITGLRYTWEEKSDVGGTIDLNDLFGTFFGTPAPGFGSCLLSPTCTPPAGAVQLAAVDTTITDRNWSWKVGLDWKVDENTLIYANASQGVKSGGFFSGIATFSFQLAPYKPETLVAYEIGLKKQYRSLQFTGSAFYYDYSDVQTFIREDVLIPVQRLGNVEEATIYGADFDLVWRPQSIEGLKVQASLGLLDTELGAFTTASINFPKGNKLPNASDVTFSATLGYDIPLGDELFLGLTGSTHYASEVFKDALNDPLIAAESYWTFNASAALFSAADGWDIRVWGKNLADEQHETQGLNVLSLGYGNRTYSAPRTYGVTLSKHFD